MATPGHDATIGTPPYAEAERHRRSTHDVFVSYSSHDKPVADAIVSRFEQAGIRCWVAPRDVMPGKLWGEAIVQAIEASRLMVVVLSGESNHSRHVLREVERAIHSDVVVIPFRIESIEPSGAMAFYIASEHWLDAVTPPLDAHIAKLVAAARSLLGSGPRADDEPAASPLASPPAGRGPRRRATRWLGGPRFRARAIVVGASVAAAGLAAALLFAFALSDRSRPTPPKMVPLGQLARSDCVRTPEAYDRDAASRIRFWVTEIPWPSEMPVVPCSSPHSGEVFFAGDIWPRSQAYPGSSAVERRFWSRCASEFGSYAGVPSGASASNYTGTFPDEMSWDRGERRIFCVAYDTAGGLVDESIRHSGSAGPRVSQSSEMTSGPTIAATP